MRYIILKNNITLNEIRSRQEYLYDVFKLYTIPIYFENYIVLKSIPETKASVIFIRGHNNDVYNFLKSYKPKERIIVLITCYIGLITKIRFYNKQVFFTKPITDRFNGNEYGFNFGITNAEIDLYNCPYEKLYKKIGYSFERIC